MKIVIDDSVYQKCMHWVNKSTNECSWLGTVKQEENGIYRVTNAFMVPQQNSATETELTGEGIARLMYKVKREMGIDEPLKWWGHSHVKMGVFWSATDHAAMRDFGSTDWILCTVFNQMEETRSAYFHPTGQKIIKTLPTGIEESNAALLIDELPTEIDRPVNPEVAAWDREYSDNVIPPKPVTRYTGPYASGEREYCQDWMGYGTPKPVGKTPAQELEEKYTWSQIERAIWTTFTGMRPAGMSKRDFKCIQKLNRQGYWDEDNLGPDDIDLNDLESKGFNAESVTALTGEHGFTRDDIKRIVDLGYTAYEIGTMTEIGDTRDQIMAVIEMEERDIYGNGIDAIN